MPAPYKRLGRIIKTHGTQGEVSVAPGDGLSFVRRSGADVWIVPPPASGAVPHRITDVRTGPKGALVTLSGITDAAASHELVGRWLLVAGEEPGVAAEPEDVIGYRVIDEERGDLGTVAEIIVTGANDVLVVHDGPFGEVLIPVIDQVILEVDREQRVLSVALLEGLIDEE